MKIGIGGIKFSEELVQVSYRALSSSDSTFIDLIRYITEKRINLPFICSGVNGEAVLHTFCIAASDFVVLSRFLDTLSPPGGPEDALFPGDSPGCTHLTVTHKVGTLTVFPHKRSLALLGRIVAKLGQSGIVIHSLCTSISALAINVDYHILDLAVEVLGEIVELPDNHAPFRPEFCVRQVSP